MKHMIEKDGRFSFYRDPWVTDGEGTRHLVKGLSKAEKLTYNIYECEENPPPTVRYGQTAIPNEEPTISDGVAVLSWSVIDVLPIAVRINHEADRRLSEMAGAYSREERETWHNQVREAQAVKAGSVDAPMLSILAQAKGVTLEAMADRVLFLSGQLATASALILSKRNALLDMENPPEDYDDDKYWSAS